jgi:hypothetical protein
LTQRCGGRRSSTRGDQETFAIGNAAKRHSECRFEAGRLKRFGNGAMRDHPAFGHQYGIIRRPRSGVDLMQHKDDSCAVRCCRTQPVEHVMLMRRIEVRKRFIGDDPAGATGKDACKQNACPFPPRHLADRARGEMEAVGCGKRFIDGFGIFGGCRREGGAERQSAE